MFLFKFKFYFTTSKIRTSAYPHFTRGLVFDGTVNVLLTPLPALTALPVSFLNLFDICSLFLSISAINGKKNHNKTALNILWSLSLLRLGLGELYLPCSITFWSISSSNQWKLNELNLKILMFLTVCGKEARWSLNSFPA